MNTTHATQRAFPSARRRAQCPSCYRSVSVTRMVDAGRGVIRQHSLLGVACPGSGTVHTVNPSTEVEVR